MNAKIIKALKASLPYATAGIAAVCVLAIPEIAHAATGIQSLDNTLRFISPLAQGAGGVFATYGIAKAGASVAMDAASHGDAIVSGAKRVAGGGTMVLAGTVGSQLSGGSGTAGFSLLDATHAATTAVSAFAFTGGGF